MTVTPSGSNGYPYTKRFLRDVWTGTRSAFDGSTMFCPESHGPSAMVRTTVSLPGELFEKRALVSGVTTEIPLVGVSLPLSAREMTTRRAVVCDTIDPRFHTADSAIFPVAESRASHGARAGQATSTSSPGPLFLRRHLDFRRVLTHLVSTLCVQKQI